MTRILVHRAKKDWLSSLNGFSEITISYTGPLKQECERDRFKVKEYTPY